MSDSGNRLPIIEALIFSSPEPLPTSKIINIMQSITAGEINNIVTELNEKYLNSDASFRIRKIAGGYQVYITEHYAGYVEELFTRRRIQKLTRAALETLAIIAYRQPVTRGDIEMIRGVSSDSAVRTLLERKFITLSGRAKTIGRPLLYSTTNEFLKYFSLNALSDLPKMEEIEELLSAKEPESQQILAFEAAENKQDSDLAVDEKKVDEDKIDVEKNDDEEIDEESLTADQAIIFEPVANDSDNSASENIEADDEPEEIVEKLETEIAEVTEVTEILEDSEENKKLEELQESIEPEESEGTKETEETKKSDSYDESIDKNSTIESPINRIEHLAEDIKEEFEQDNSKENEEFNKIQTDEEIVENVPDKEEKMEEETVNITTTRDDF